MLWSVFKVKMFKLKKYSPQKEFKLNIILNLTKNLAMLTTDQLKGLFERLGALRRYL